MPADITFSDRSEYRIADRVKQHICVRVPQETGFMGDINPAQDQPAPRHQTVHVVTMTYSHKQFL
jgi:hypothetical protein